jgi:hypothetical protein
MEDRIVMWTPVSESIGSADRGGKMTNCRQKSKQGEYRRTPGMSSDPPMTNAGR